MQSEERERSQRSDWKLVTIENWEERCREIFIKEKIWRLKREELDYTSLWKDNLKLDTNIANKKDNSKKIEKVSNYTVKMKGEMGYINETKIKRQKEHLKWYQDFVKTYKEWIHHWKKN